MDRNNSFEIDRITWNDLSLDEFYSRLNSCVTSAGDDYLFNRLKNPFICECEDFAKQRKLIEEADELKNNESLKSALNTISRLKNYSFYDELNAIKEAEAKSNLSHYIISALVVLSFALIFVYPGPGIVLFFGMIAYAVSDYFKTKNIIAGKLTVFNYIIKMLKRAGKIKADNTDNTPVFRNLVLRLKEISNVYKPFMRGTFIISEGAKTNSNPFSILFDYVRMIFHADIIKYNSMIGFLKENVELIEEFYSILGMLDTAICINEIRNNEGIFAKEICKAEFIDDNKIVTTDIYHPLIKDAVVNSIDTDKNILITGCNASGKSTFLKTIILNAIFAQGFGFAFAKNYKASFFKIYSSMALKDDINAGESYFMAEIKSLKRIVDACEEDDDINLSPYILCAIDEVLRGTNTIERIASSAEILNSLCRDNVLCFAATHDLELTELLSDKYINYHFTEEVSEEDVVFNYRINKGAANSRNAIRLLSVLGYSDEIVKKATNRANAFVINGVWPPL